MPRIHIIGGIETMNYLTRFLLITIVTLFVIPSLNAQTEFHVGLYAADGSGWVDSVIIGRYLAATDMPNADSLGPQLKEAELPPPPPVGAANVRLIDPGSIGGYGTGTRVDLRHLESDAQVDIYRVWFRRNNPGGTGIVLSWHDLPEGIRCILQDGSGGFIFPPVDMHQDSSYTHPIWADTNGYYADIIVGGDTSVMRTFTMESIGLATDSKGKLGKYEKRKPWATDFSFTLLVPAGGADHILLDLKKQVDGLVSFPGDTTGRVPIPLVNVKKTTLDFNPPLPEDQQVRVEGRAYNQTKPFQQQYQWGLGSTLGAKTKIAAYDYQWQRLRMPNINNLGEELYASAVTLPLGLPDPVGVADNGKPVFRNILHNKAWKDVQKTFLKKIKGVYELQDGPANCLDTLKDKMVLKTLKNLEPHKAVRHKNSVDWGNKLVGELLALKFNIAISAYGHTPSLGFGELIFTDGDHPYDGLTVNEIAAMGDSALSCVGGLRDTFSCGDLADFIGMLNAEFSGEFDTLNFSTKTVVSGVKTVAESHIFRGSSLSFAPVPPRDYTSLYDRPGEMALAQNYPNPFNPTTTIEFTLPEDAVVTLKVYNMIGQEVMTLADQEEFPEGENRVELDGSSLASGVYAYRIVTGDGRFQVVKKMLLVK